MVKYDGKIVQFGFGAVGKSFYEKVSKEIKYDEYRYFIITGNPEEFDDYINLGGMVTNFILCEIREDNFRSVFGEHLSCGDLLLDFSDTVGTHDICDWCADNNIMYISTADADWPENWPSVFEMSRYVESIKEKHRDNHLTNRHPIVLQHGNNPGLVSHFVKAGIEYIVNTQYKKDMQLKTLIMQNKFNEAAHILGVRMIHVNDVDVQELNADYEDGTLLNTWCIDSFLFEMLSEATMNTGSHETVDYYDGCKFFDPISGFLEFNKLAAEIKCRTYCPNGVFEGFMVPHDETVTIAKNLELRRDGNLIYRPSVMFIYSPCFLAGKYLSRAKVNDYPEPDMNKPPDCDDENGQTVIRGYMYPKYADIAYRDRIASGTEYVGVLLIGDNFEPVWVGNRVELSFLYRKPKDSCWQTPTITPVAMSALAAVCWMIKNKNKGGVYVPDDILEYKDILKMAEKYISKTIYKTISKRALERMLGIDLSSLQSKDFLVSAAAPAAATTAAAVAAAPAAAAPTTAATAMAV